MNTPRLPSFTSTVAPLLAIALLIGGLAGGVAGYWAAGTRPALESDGTDTTRLSVEEESATTAVVERASPAVVSVIQSKDLASLRSPVSPFDEFFGFTQPEEGLQETGRGSGFIVSADGLIVTNKHVVDDDQAEYTVIMHDDRRFTATIKAKDPTNDIAILKIEATDLPTLPLGDSTKVKIGQTVIAIGDPLSFRNSVTKGVISGTARTIQASDGSGQAETLEDIFQTDAAINPGNSGGPLLDLAGSVIAVNTAVSQSGQLIGFAIPIEVVKRDLESLEKNGKIVRPFLGVRYVLLDKEYAERNNLPVEYGALLQAGRNDEPAVVADSPADKAGLRAGDIILEVNGRKIDENHSLVGLLSQFNPGQTITVKVRTGDDTKDVSITLGERSE